MSARKIQAVVKTIITDPLFVRAVAVAAALAVVSHVAAIELATVSELMEANIFWVQCAFSGALAVMMTAQYLGIHFAERRRRNIQKEYLRCRAEGRTWAPFG